MPDPVVHVRDRARPPKVNLLVIPVPGKQSHLVMVIRPWRSKWPQVSCGGQAKKCQAAECKHVQAVCSAIPRSRAIPLSNRSAPA